MADGRNPIRSASADFVNPAFSLISYMARHLEFTVSTGVKVYFCDPQSPWQRGTNENTNGLIRQYFPKKTCLAQYTQHELDLVAAQLNNRPRKTLKFKTPKEIIERGVALTD